MASVNWHKMTTQKAGAMNRHNGTEERMSIDHSNEDIDKSKSHLNFSIGADDYKPAFERLKKRIAEEDEIHPPKKKTKDRITSFMLYAPLPQKIADMGDDAIHQFYEGLHALYGDFFGVDNVMGTFVHLDEQHSYIDHGQEKMSLIHSHTLISAYAKWKEKDGTEREGINGKHCSSRARLNALNKKIDAWVYDTYGIHYNNGNEARKQTVERLKAESMKEEITKLEKEIKAKEDRKADALKNWGMLGKNKMSEEEYAKYRALMDKESDFEGLEKDKQELAKLQKELDQKERWLNQRDDKYNYNFYRSLETIREQERRAAQAPNEALKKENEKLKKENTNLKNKNKFIRRSLKDRKKDLPPQTKSILDNLIEIAEELIEEN